MDLSEIDHHIENYQDFLRNCKVVEEERLPQHEVEIVWKNVDIEDLASLKTVKIITKSGVGPDANGQESGPLLDLTWSCELELLPVIDDGTVSRNIRVPFEKSQALKHLSLPQPTSTSAGPSDLPSTSSDLNSRVNAFREGISRRIQGLRSGEHRRSVQDTVQRNKDPKNPDCTLLAVVKWEGPSEGGFSVVSAEFKVGPYTVTATEPLSAHFVEANSFVVDTASALQWSPSSVRGGGFPFENGVMSLETWKERLDMFPLLTANCVTLTLIIQLNELSIPRIGFPFASLLNGDQADFDATIQSLQTPLSDNQHVAVEGTDGITYTLLKDDLTKSSAYFRAFLTEEWSHGSSTVAFPLVPPFTTCSDLIPFIVYFMTRKTLLFGLSENAADLIVAADALGMPELTKLAEVAAIPNITLENVARLTRLAWQFRAGVLFRAALIFLRVNYDEIWVENREDLADLGKVLSSEHFLPAFTRMTFDVPESRSV